MGRTSTYVVQALCGVLPVLILLMPVGCASGRADWYAIYEARADVDALKAAPYADLIDVEIAHASEMLGKAEAALTDKKLHDVARISELVSLQAEYAHAVASATVARREAETAIEALEAAAQRADARRKELRLAHEALDTARAKRPSRAK